MPLIDSKKLNTEITDKYSIANNAFLQVAKDNPKDKIEAIIGDDKQPSTFYPQIKIQRWDNEVNFSARLINEEAAPVVSTLSDKIVWDGQKVAANFYDLTEDEGGYEFEVILKEKPKTNIVSFTIQTKGLDFFYQPALTEEEIKEGAERPENVVGSYAVYAKTPKTNWTGGKEYKCGKVGHIFRPKIIDSAGTEVWGDLHIENGILSVTIPQDFLDKAVYPVRHAAGLTFGYTSVGGSSGRYFYNSLTGSGNKYAGAVGTGVSMSAYAKTNGSSYLLQMGVYTWSTTVGSFISNSNTPSVTVNSTTPAWKTGTYVTAPTFSAVDYLLLFNCNSHNLYIYYDDGADYGIFQSYGNVTFDTWPETVTDNTSGSAKIYSIYATYTAEESGTEYTLDCSATSFSLTGKNTTFTRSRTLTASATAFSFTAINSILSYRRTLIASATAFAVTGINAIITSARHLTASATTFAITGVNALLYRQGTKGVQADALLAKANQTKSISVDARLYDQGTKTFVCDALLAKSGQQKGFLADAMLIYRKTKGVVLDALIYKVFEKTLLVDALLFKQNTKTLQVDAKLVSLGKEKSIAVDAKLYSTGTKAVAIDALLAKANQTKSFAVDARLFGGGMKLVTLDALLAKQNQTKSVLAYALLFLRKTKAVAVDASIFKTQTKAITVDALLVSRKTKQVEADAFIVAVKTKELVADAKLYKTGTKSLAVDARIVRGGTKSFVVDAFLAKTGLKSFAVDASLWRRVLRALSVDALLFKRSTKAFEVDADLAYGYKNISVDAKLVIVKNDVVVYNKKVSPYTLKPSPYSRKKDFIIE